MNADRDSALDWPEGRIDYLVHGLQVTDGRGIVRGWFRPTKTALQFAEAPDKPKPGKKAAKPSFRDCTERWASFPGWVRRGITAKLTAHNAVTAS